jgi:murein DD-endopeptidase MepM/ murein hydrolase activator NlpD
MLKLRKKIKDFFLQDRELIFVSKGKIFTAHFDCKRTLCLIGIFCWVIFSSVKFFEYRNTINRKIAQIDNLNTINRYYKAEIEFVNSNLKDIHSYITALNKYDRFNTVGINYDEEKLLVKSPNLLPKEIKLTERERNTIHTITLAGNKLQNIQKDIRKRNTGLEKIMAMTGITHQKNVKTFVEGNNILQGNNTIAKYEGHNFIIPVNSNNDNNDKSNLLTFTSLKNDVKYMSNLENKINALPLSTPLSGYYVSSNFGKRRNPVTRRRTIHVGLDMAGTYKTPIYSTAKGTVVFAGYKGSYGKLVKIKHDSGIYTYYGHLNKIKVKPGDKVKRGQVIGNQGNTGRSTGQHLHYEVRLNGEPYNPKNFLRTGTKLF